MINIWDMKPEDIAIIKGKRWRWKRDFRQRRGMLGVVPVRELVEIGNEKNKQKFIRGIDVELEATP